MEHSAEWSELNSWKPRLQCSERWFGVFGVNGRMLRPAEILCSDAEVTKVAKLLGWSAKNKMADVVRIMVEAEGQFRLP